MRKDLEAKNLENRGEAQQVADKLNGQSFVAIRQASEGGQLYGSVSARDIADLVTAGGFQITRSQVELHAPIKAIGQHKVAIALHPEVEVNVTLNVARNAEEAERVARGEDVTIRREDAEIEREQAAAAAEAFFDPEARREGEGEEAAETAEQPAETKA
jgi:large subunit ribosomal protein L9